MITSYNYEGKIKEEVLKNCLNELNVSENDLYIKEESQESGLFNINNSCGYVFCRC